MDKTRVLRMCFLFWIIMLLIVKAGMADVVNNYVRWDELMAPMDWTSNYCSYTVAGTTVTRTNDIVTIIGGNIGQLRSSGGVRLSDCYKATTYVFENVGISDIYVGVDDFFSGTSDYANREYRIVLEETAVVYGGINALQTLNTTVEVINNGVIYGDNTYCTLSLSLDGGSTFILSGSGKIYTPDNGISLYDSEPAVVGHLSLSIDGVSRDDQDAVKQIVDTLKNVQIDFGQFQGEPVVYTYFGWIKDYYDREAFEYDVHEEECAISNDELSAMDDALQLVVSPHEDSNLLTLRSKVYWIENNNALFYNHLVDSSTQSYRLKEPAKLYIPYPAGITKDNAYQYEFSIDLPILDGDSVLSSSFDTVAATDCGLEIEVEEIIPFCMSWKQKELAIATPSPVSSIGDVVRGEQIFRNYPEINVLTLVVPDGVSEDISAILQYDMQISNSENLVVYNVQLINPEGKEICLPAEGAILCFPYPEELKENSRNKYRIVIHHYVDNGETEVFRSEDGDIEFTKQGLCIRVSSLSPFEITWEEMPEIDLPKTGDNSSIAQWFLILMLAMISSLSLKRKEI